jgi:multidrug efflux pump subunit AcrA (membrane-fusion protein)
MKLHGMAVALAGWMGLIGSPVWAADTVELSTRVSGVVAEVRVKPGQRVKKGTVLLRLDKTVLQAQLDEANAEQARAQADAGDARRELERVQELYKRTVSSTSMPPRCAMRVRRQHWPQPRRVV